MTRVLVMGGSDAGNSAALRIEEMDAQADVIAGVVDAYPNFSICDLLFYISGEVEDRREARPSKVFPRDMAVLR